MEEFPLDDDSIRNIFSRLYPKDLLSATKTSKLFREIGDEFKIKKYKNKSIYRYFTTVPHSNRFLLIKPYEKQDEKLNELSEIIGNFQLISSGTTLGDVIITEEPVVNSDTIHLKEFLYFKRGFRFNNNDYKLYQNIDINDKILNSYFLHFKGKYIITSRPGSVSHKKYMTIELEKEITINDKFNLLVCIETMKYGHDKYDFYIFNDNFYLRFDHNFHFLKEEIYFEDIKTVDIIEIFDKLAFRFIGEKNNIYCGDRNIINDKYITTIREDYVVNLETMKIKFFEIKFDNYNAVEENDVSVCFITTDRKLLSNFEYINREKYGKYMSKMKFKEMGIDISDIESSYLEKNSYSENESSEEEDSDSDYYENEEKSDEGSDTNEY